MTLENKEQVLAKYSQFFDVEINLHLRPAAKELLINYSKVPEKEVESHILKVVGCISSSLFFGLANIPFPNVLWGSDSTFSLLRVQPQRKQIKYRF